jgi:Uma2 family endonuclease
MTKITDKLFLSDDSKQIAPAGKIGFETFLEWLDEDTHADWIEGEVQMTSPASYKHQNSSGFLNQIMRTYVNLFDLGVVLSAPFVVKIGRKSREPDLFFVRKERINLLQATFFDGAPDLIIEIVSPESQERDRQTKFTEYQQGGVSEYWLIDPLTEEIEYYRLDENGQYQNILPSADGFYFSNAVPNLRFKSSWLWAVREPALTRVMREMGEAVYQKFLDED